jgi:hypothetical protein
MQLLEVLDLELEELLRRAVIHRLIAPTCEQGMLRGRTTARAGIAPGPELRSDCTSRSTPTRDEADSLAHGYATLTRVT